MIKKKRLFSFLKKLSLFSFLFTLVTPVLSGCGAKSNEESLSKTTKPDTSIESASNQKDPTDSLSQDASGSTLAVDESRCIGCGKCPRFAPENFLMDPATGKAFVTSQENTDSASIKRAVSACPTSAISV